ncbi:MAG: hypothetical protein COA40_01230 [Aequorivita sp.]|nr:MAG: hypothetical protein COA40_01230 [Aequorivita sp.]
MKKVIFCAVALMMGAVGLAQTTPVAPSAPANAQALTPMAPAPATANMSHSIQNGNDNKVAVTQIGTSQGAYSDQDNGSGLGFNQARILQTGNVSASSGVANMAEVYQRGTGNQSTQAQYGDYNESLVRQGSSNNSSLGNRALAQQGNAAAQNGQGNQLQIDQDGNGNQARTQQRFDNNDALTDQDGDLHYADVWQRANPNGSDGHAAHIDQDGLGNDAWVRQDGLGERNEASSLQDGTGNYSWQEQYSTTTAGADPYANNALVAQGTNTGNAMTVVIDSDMNTNVDSYHVGINTTSNYNKAFQFQNGGNFNDVASFQRGTSNYSEQHQDGAGNEALVVQSFYDPSALTGLNYAKQTQDGDNNQAGIGQNGYLNRALQSQIGDGNKALSTQQGHDNDVNIHQRGDMNSATSAQRAACNDILIVQYDGQSASVEQNLTGGLGNNTANIYQSGPDGGGGAINCGFDPQLPMTPRNPIPVFNIPDVCPGC